MLDIKKISIQESLVPFHKQINTVIIMRCKNCGWPNEPNVSRCIKCNAPLSGSMVDSGRNSSTASSEPEESLKATIREASSGGGFDDSANNGNSTCPRCGYPISDGMGECPVCHAQIGQDSIRQDANRNQSNNRRGNIPNQNRGGFRPGAGTINPWSTPSDDSFCTLRRIPWQNEHVTYEPVSYSGEEIVLNRANTDANNNSITSREQAVISHENGEWYIENRSDLQTTLIRVDRRLKLEDGDVVVLGNRMFEFRKG